MSVAFNFNAADYAPNTGAGSVLPTGDYPVAITHTEVKNTNSGNGQFLVVQMTVQDGQFRGKKVTDRLNLVNPSDDAVQIAYATLSAICHVTGRMSFQNTAELHGIPFMISVEEVPRDDKPDKMSNNILAYMDAQGRPPGNVASAPASTPNSAPTAGGPVQPTTAPAAAPAPAPAAAAAPATAPSAAAPAPASAPAPAPAPQPAAQAPAAPAPASGGGSPAPWE